MENINKQFEIINEILDRIDVKQKEINEKLDELIKALHEYDDDLIYEPNEALLAAAEVYNEEVANKRMDVIGQNGNTGEHYENEIINNPANTNVDKKKRSGRKYYKPKNK
jgi:hypothetical protein